MKKLILLICCMFLCACTNQSYTKEEEALIQKAETIMHQLQKEEFERIASEFSILISPSSGNVAAAIQQGWEAVPQEYGKFLGVDHYVILHLKDATEVKIIVNYEHYKAQFTMAFLNNGKLAGLFFK